MSRPDIEDGTVGCGHARSCPSARCEEGAILLGIVGRDGVVGFIDPPMRIDAAFVETARAGRAPEKRFRFAGRCVENDCTHWSSGRCRVIDAALETFGEANARPPGGGLRLCGLRPSCRWFAQAGADACSVCPLIVTEPGG